MKNLLIFGAVALAATTLITSCNGITNSINDTLHGRAKKNNGLEFASSSYSGSTDNFLTDSKALTKAEELLRGLSELKGKKINIYDDAEFFSDGRIMLQVQDPDTPKNVNEYDYNGDWSAAKPVNITSADAGNIGAKSILLDSIPFSAVSKIAAIYGAKVKSVASTSDINHVYYVPEAGEWYCNDIKGARASYELYFHPNGTLKELKQE